MLIFDQLKKNDPQLRLFAAVVLGGLLVLFAGLWWVQIASYRDYKTNLETQSFRTVRIPAVRGKILDRNGVVLAENQPTYNMSLYLDELRKQMDATNSAMVSVARSESNRLAALEEKRLGRKLSRDEKKGFLLTSATRSLMRQQARYVVASNVVQSVAVILKQPLSLDRKKFDRHYLTKLALPFPVLSDLDQVQIARFQEQISSPLGVDLEIQSTRYYPHQTLAAHVIGFLTRDDRSREGEESFVSHRLPDFVGVVGIEAGFDRQLRGKAGVKSVLVNNIGYRQTENVWSPAEQGKSVSLTLDHVIQNAAERALPVYGADTRGAVVVLDVKNGDILAMASGPAPNPNHFVNGFPPGEGARMNHPKLRSQINRATQENYAPGSIFKTVTGLALLQAGIDPQENIYNPGQIYVGRRSIDDLAPAGVYDFRRALKLSSNTYFITNALRIGIEPIVKLGEALHLGERTGLPTRQEVSGVFPSMVRVAKGWSAGDTANLSIGQGPISVTPLQMAVVTAAVANGGKVFRPRLVRGILPPETAPFEAPAMMPPAEVRTDLKIQKKHLQALHDAMLADVEDDDGTGRAAAIPGFRICGKTGTAQVTNQGNEVVDHTTWFACFAPYEDPTYAVVVMVESGGSGGGTCAPIAKRVFQAILERERLQSQKAQLARAQR